MTTIDLYGSVLAAYDETPFPEQRAMFLDDRRFVAGFVEVRGGKSEGMALKFADRIAEELFDHLEAVRAGTAEEWEPISGEPMSDRDEPRRLYWVVAPTYVLAKIAWRKVLTALSLLGPLVVKVVSGEAWLSGGTLVQMKTGKDESQLQGDKVHGALVDEVCTLPESSWNQIENRITDARGWALLIGSPRPGTWPKRRLWDEGDSPEMGLHTWPTLANPHIPREEIERKRRVLPKKWFDRDFGASWDTFDGLIYDDWSAESVVDLDMSRARYWRVDAAIDFGFRRPALMLVAEVPGLGDVVIDEVVAQDVKLSRALHDLCDLADGHGVRIRDAYVDPAGKARNEQTKVRSTAVVRQVLTDRSHLFGAVKYPQGLQRNILDGVATVASRVRLDDGTRRLFVRREVAERVYPSPLVGIQGSLQGYVWKENAVDTPAKDGVHDHFCDAIRYLLVKKHGLVRMTGMPDLPSLPPALPEQMDVDAGEWASRDEYDPALFG